MFAHHEFNQLGIVFFEAVLLAKTAHFDRTQRRMVAAASFGNIVEQRSGKKQKRFIPTAGKLRAKRVFVRVFDDKKAPHIAQHHHDVLIDRVNVE